MTNYWGVRRQELYTLNGWWGVKLHFFRYLQPKKCNHPKEHGFTHKGPCEEECRGLNDFRYYDMVLDSLHNFGKGYPKGPRMKLAINPSAHLSIYIKPTLGPKAYKHYILSAIGMPRVRSRNPRPKGGCPCDPRLDSPIGHRV